MTGSLPKTVWLVLAAVIIAGGCRGKSPAQTGPLDREPAVGQFVAPAGYAARAIEAAGGLAAWKRSSKLELDSVVTIYDADGSFYLTEHHYEIYPWSNSIRISAREPLGSFVWQLSDGKYEVTRPEGTADVSPLRGSYRAFAEAILTVMTAPVHLCDESLLFVQERTAVKMQGLWYYPIERICPDEQVAPGGGRRSVPQGAGMLAPSARRYDWSRVILYQNRDNSLVDMLWFADVDKGRFFAVRGYDYDEPRGKVVLLPTRVEIFRTDARAVPKELLVRVDVK